MPPIGLKEEIHRLVEKSDNQILRAVKAMLEAYYSENWADEGVNDLNRDIEASNKEFAEGEFYTQEQATKISDQWRHQKI